MRIALLLFVAMLLVAPRIAPAAGPAVTAFYVSPAGADTNPGTQKRPFLTLARAQQAVRETRAALKDKCGPLEVQIRAGTYYLPEPLRLGPEDSGTQAAPVTWRAYGQEKPVLSGGQRLTGWEKGQGQIWKTHVAAAEGGRWPFRQLFLDGQRQIRARYPNHDPDHPYTGGWLYARDPKHWQGAFNRGVHSLQVKGTWLEYEIEPPTAGHYYVWMRQAHDAGVNVSAHQTGVMSGRTQIQMDGGPGVKLMNLPDTGGWGNFTWGPEASAELDLPAGKHTLRWTNVDSGGINPDALVFTDDPAWKPALPLPAVAAGKHLFVMHFEKPVRFDAPIAYFEKSASADEIQAGDGELQEWPRSPHKIVHIFPYASWFSAKVPVKRIDLAQGVIHLGEAAHGNVLTGNRYYVENLFEELDSPGEWYLDWDQGDLYFWPPAGTDLRRAVVTASRLDRLFDLQGRPEQPVQWITIAGLTLKDAEYTDQKDVYYPADGAVFMQNAANCAVLGNSFLSVGGYALWLRESSHDNRFEQNLVEYPGDGGVLIDGGAEPGSHKPHPLGLQPYRNRIENNYIHHGGRIYAHVAGVYVHQARGNLIAHNRIEEVPRYAISLKYDSPGNRVEYNRVSRTNLETNDTGGIEEYANPGPNTIRFNLVADTIGAKHKDEGGVLTPTYTWGIYLDGASSNTTVYGNLVYRYVLGGVFMASGTGNRVQNNVLVGGSDGQVWWSNYTKASKGNVFQRNIVAYGSPESTLWNAVPPSAEWVDADHNLYWRPEPALDLGLLQAAGLEKHSVVADPLFVNWQQDDFRLKKESPAFALGFVALPIDQMGLSKPVGAGSWTG